MGTIKKKEIMMERISLIENELGKRERERMKEKRKKKTKKGRTNKKDREK